MTEREDSIAEAASGISGANRSIMSSAEALARERERIFAECWLYLGHESELPYPGDYRRCNLGGRQVLFVRGSDGVVRAFLNACTHLGALVCRQDEGNAETFQCFYHGWTFDNKGQLIGIRGQSAYPPISDPRKQSLPPLRLESYRGFYFVSFNPEINSLLSYLKESGLFADLIDEPGGQEPA